MDFNEELENLIKANISAIYIQSFEWQRFKQKLEEFQKIKIKDYFTLILLIN